MKKLNCIMLIDDNMDDNFYHERVIRKNNAADVVLAKTSGPSALEYLKSRTNDKGTPPDLIFLDINMPGMNGWEFLQEYNKLDKELQSKAVVVMLTTSENPDDKSKAKMMNLVADFRTKPLTKEILDEVISTHF